MDNITAPFTPEQVKALNEYQQLSFVPAFSCCGTTTNGETCKRNETNNFGTLIATEQGWVCPCGKYTQNWAHAIMAEPEKVKEAWEKKFKG